MKKSEMDKVETEAFEKFKKFLEEKQKFEAKGEDVIIFTEDEVKILRRVIDHYKGLQAVGMIGSWFKTIVIWIGVMLGAFAAAKVGIVDFIKESVGK